MSILSPGLKIDSCQEREYYIHSEFDGLEKKSPFPTDSQISGDYYLLIVCGLI